MEADTQTETSAMADELERVSRPVGGTEHSWCRSVPGGTGTTVLLLLLSKPIPISSLQSALYTLQINHPILRSHLSFPHDSPPLFSIPPSPSISINTKSLPSPFHSLLELELNENPWSDPNPDETVPVFFATIYESPKLDESILVMKFHTAVCDRTSAASIIMELMDLIGREGTGEKSGIDEVAIKAGLEDLVPKQDTYKPFWTRGKDLLGYSLNGLRSCTLQFEDTDSVRRSEVIRLVFTKEETDILLSECKERGVKLCGAFSGAALVVARSSKQLAAGQSETYSVVTLIDCRNYLEAPLDKHNAGFYYSAITNTHTITGGEGLWELAKRCHDSYSDSISNRKHLRDLSELNFLMCKAIENPHLTTSSALRTALISVFEEPILYDSCDMKKSLGVEDYVGCASTHGIGPSIGVFDMIRDGQLDCAFVYPAPLHSREQMENIVDSIKSVLLEGCIHVDLD
ncbi:GATA zinc finger protein [Carex rostrata]